MKQCKNCQTIYNDEFAFCPECGSPVSLFVEEVVEVPVAEEIPVQPIVVEQPPVEAMQQNAVEFKFCSNCGNKISKQCNFCEFCGAKVGQTVPAVNKLKENELVKSVSQDFKNSTTVDMIKQKTKGIGNKINSSDKLKGLKNKKALIIVVVVVALVALLSSIHKCDECEEIYLGKPHEVTMFGESYELCDDCYDIWW